MNPEITLNAEVIQQIFALLPADQQANLLAVITDEQATTSQMEAAVSAALTSLDPQIRQEQIGPCVAQLLPLDLLVPAIYQPWRAVVRDAAVWVGQHLSASRMIPKLARQLLLSPDTPLHRRLLIFVEQMPALQKIGQMLARNPHLDAELRAELTRLENSIQDIAPAEVFAVIDQQLGGRASRYQIEMQEVLLAEASVSAVVRFSWRNPATRQREQGVFKVLKPYVLPYFAEELQILRGLADFFDQHHAQYNLPAAGFRDMMDEIRHLLQREVNLPNEQAALIEAYNRYASIPGIVIPKLIPELCSATITAMHETQGVKVTSAFARTPAKRRKVAEQLIEALIATPIFAPEAQATFHADPHAGNLLVNEQTHALILLDWALVERLSREQRRQFVLLHTALAWRDAERAAQAVFALATVDQGDTGAQTALIRGRIAQFFGQLAPFVLPDITQVVNLLDTIVASGVRFPAELLLFRKMFFTLVGVLHDLAPDVKIDVVIARYLLKLMLQETPRRWLLPFTDPSPAFASHLSNYDLTYWTLTLPLVGTRIWLQSSDQMTDAALHRLQQILERQISLPRPDVLTKLTAALPEGWSAKMKTIRAPETLAIPVTNEIVEKGKIR